MSSSYSSDEKLEEIYDFSYNNFVQGQRHIKISVNFKQILKTRPEVFQPPVFYITTRGILHGLRQPQDGYFKIGRQQINEIGQRPNDLILSPSDKAVSRSHCMIEYKHFINTLPTDSKIALLMGQHKRLGQNSILQMLPIELFKYIFSFFSPKTLPSLIDLGSIFGTYVKILNTQFFPLKAGMNFLVGSNINIEIENLKNDPIPPSFNSENTVEDLDIFQDYPNLTIKLSRQEQRDEVQLSSWKFVAEQNYKEINIGRSKCCDIKVNENTVSRIQCRVLYIESQWVILDGTTDKPTSNGTWLCISKKNNVERKHSKPYKLESGTQIKVSDTIIQIDLY